MSRKTTHIVPQDGRWAAKPEGSSRASRIFETKAEAVELVTRQARDAGNASVVIHGRDGTIQEERTYGNDPFPPKG